MRALIIGFGNVLRRDDGLGPLAIEALSRMLPPETAALESAHQLTPEMAEPIGRADLVLFIDAAAGEPPGAVVEREVRAEDVHDPAALFHHVSPASLLAGAALLYGRAPRAILFTVAGEDFGYGSGLSETVAHALDDVIRRIPEVLALNDAAPAVARPTRNTR